MSDPTVVALDGAFRGNANGDRRTTAEGFRDTAPVPRGPISQGDIDRASTAMQAAVGRAEVLGRQVKERIAALDKDLTLGARYERELAIRQSVASELRQLEQDAITVREWIPAARAQWGPAGILRSARFSANPVEHAQQEMAWRARLDRASIPELSAYAEQAAAQASAQDPRGWALAFMVEEALSVRKFDPHDVPEARAWLNNLALPSERAKVMKSLGDLTAHAANAHIRIQEALHGRVSPEGRLDAVFAGALK